MAISPNRAQEGKPYITEVVPSLHSITGCMRETTPALYHSH